MLLRLGIVNGMLLKCLVYQGNKNQNIQKIKPEETLEKYQEFNQILKINEQFNQNNKIFFLNITAILITILFRLRSIEQIRFEIITIICILIMIFISLGSLFKILVYFAQKSHDIQTNAHDQD